jgi:dipeptidase E
MKLYLSSYRIPTPEDLYKLLDKTPGETKVAIIPNAKDYYADRARKFKIEEMRQFIQALGLQAGIVDLKEYESPLEVKSTLKNFDMVWVSGGNTFCLRYEMQRSGFDTVIKELLDDGLVYAGESAGSCVAGTSLKGLENADEPAFAEAEVWEGLGLIPHFVLPHADNPMFAEDTAQTRELYIDDESLIELKDSQALVVNGDRQTITDSSNL